MSTASILAPLEIPVLDQIYGWEAYLLTPPEDFASLNYKRDQDLHSYPPGNTMDRWLDLSA